MLIEQIKGLGILRPFELDISVSLEGMGLLWQPQQQQQNSKRSEYPLAFSPVIERSKHRVHLDRTAITGNEYSAPVFGVSYQILLLAMTRMAIEMNIKLVIVSTTRSYGPWHYCIPCPFILSINSTCIIL